jgi:hypothetical protein
MEHYPTVIVHSFGEAVAGLAEARDMRRGITLLSAPGAALYAGCGWWQALVEAARARYPDVPCRDILDCADGTGQALAALRIGLTRLVLWPDAPGRDAVVAIAEVLGGFVLPSPPQTAPLVNRVGVNRAGVNRAGVSRHAASPAEPTCGPEHEAPGNGDKTRSAG